MITDQSSSGRVVVFGSTGTAGTGLIHACLAEAGVSEVRAITRRPLYRFHAKLRETQCSDFTDLDRIALEAQRSGLLPLLPWHLREEREG